MTTWLALQNSVLKYSAGKLVCSFGSYKEKLLLLGFSSGKEVVLGGIFFLCTSPATLQGFWGIAYRCIDLRRHVWVGSPPAKKWGTEGCRCLPCSQHSLWCKAALSAVSLPANFSHLLPCPTQGVVAQRACPGSLQRCPCFPCPSLAWAWQTVWHLLPNI